MQHHTWAWSREISRWISKTCLQSWLFEGLAVMPQLQKAQWWLIQGTDFLAFRNGKYLWGMKLVFLLCLESSQFFEISQLLFEKDYLHWRRLYMIYFARSVTSTSSDIWTVFFFFVTHTKTHLSCVSTPALRRVWFRYWLSLFTAFHSCVIVTQGLPWAPEGLWVMCAIVLWNCPLRRTLLHVDCSCLLVWLRADGGSELKLLMRNRYIYMYFFFLHLLAHVEPSFSQSHQGRVKKIWSHWAV